MPTEENAIISISLMVPSCPHPSRRGRFVFNSHWNADKEKRDA